MQQRNRSAIEFEEIKKSLPFKIDLSKYPTSHQKYRAKQMAYNAAASSFS